MKQTILITGSTDGIGKLTAIKLAKEGCQVILHGRNGEKLAAVIAEVINLTDNPNVLGLEADFSDLNAVKKMAQNLRQSFSKIDVLINNAGVFKASVVKNKDGFDIRFVVNYFAPYLLTSELMPLLIQSKTPRIINLSSAAQASISQEGFYGKSSLADREAYAQSKLALTMWSFHLAKAYPNIVVIPVNPGSLLNTNMVREAYGKYWSSADKGATILYDLSTAEKYQLESGKYFDNDRGDFGLAHPDAYDPDKISRLIQETGELIKII